MKSHVGDVQQRARFSIDPPRISSNVKSIKLPFRRSARAFREHRRFARKFDDSGAGKEETAIYIPVAEARVADH